jgi:hypothetical protein
VLAFAGSAVTVSGAPFGGRVPRETPAIGTLGYLPCLGDRDEDPDRGEYRHASRATFDLSLGEVRVGGSGQATVEVVVPGSTWRYIDGVERTWMDPAAPHTFSLDDEGGTVLIQWERFGLARCRLLMGSRRRMSSRTGVVARTVAVRGVPRTRAISPNCRGASRVVRRRPRADHLAGTLEQDEDAVPRVALRADGLPGGVQGDLEEGREAPPLRHGEVPEEGDVGEGVLDGLPGLALRAAHDDRREVVVRAGIVGGRHQGVGGGRGVRVRRQARELGLREVAPHTVGAEHHHVPPARGSG